MSYGIKVEGEDGRLLIDPDYSNYTTVESGVVNVDKDVGPDVFARSLSVSSSYANPIILFKQPVGSVVSYWGRSLYSYGTSPINVSYIILVPVSTVPASSDAYGVRVWDSAGKRVFDSGHQIIDTISTYSYVGDEEPTIPAGVDDWLMATTWGVIGLTGTTAGGNLSYCLAAFLEKLSSGYLKTRVLINGMMGPGIPMGSPEPRSPKSIYVNRCKIV